MSESSNPSRSSSGLSTACSSKLTAHSSNGNGVLKKSKPPQAITVGFVLNTLRRWWKVALPLGLVIGGIVAGLVYMTFEPMYRASCWLQIFDQAPALIYDSPERSRRFVDTQVQLIRSPLVLGPVVSQPEIARLPEVQEQMDPIRWLAGRIRVDSVGESELFTISFTSAEPANAANIANAVTNAFFELRSQYDNERTNRIIELLSEEQERRKREVRNLRENVRQTTKNLTGTDPFGPTQNPDPLLNDPLADLQRNLTTAEVEHEILKVEVQAFEEMHGDRKIKIPDGVVDMGVEKHPEIAGLKQALMAKRAKLHEVERRAAKGKGDPFYIQLAREIKQDEAAMADVRKDLREQVRTQMEADVAQSRLGELEEMRSRLESYTLMTNLLRERYETQLKARKTYSGESLDLELMRAELARAEEVHELVTARIERLRVEEGGPKRVQPMRSAETPTSPIEVAPYKKMTLAGLAAFFVPFLLAVVWERVVRRISTTEELARNADLAVIGEIARLPVRATGGRGVPAKHTGHGLRVFEESVDGLRTGLMLSEPLKEVKVLAVTSAANREGKTSVAAQLAVSIARALNEPTLLIDGDVRSPDVHNVFEIPLEPGLSEVLTAESSLEEAVVTSWSKYVHLLPAGKLHVSPHKLFGNGALRSILDELRPSYRYIIIDTPPILAASEALVLAKVSDAALMCAMRDASRADQVRLAYERLVAAGSHPVGTVLSGVPINRYAYRYGTYAYSRD